MDFPFENDVGIGKFPRISNGFEPKNLILPSSSKPDFTNIPGPGKPDFVPDFSEKLDVGHDSVCLALHTLGLSRPEFNSYTVEELKSQRKINCSCAEIWALNILIYYKKNSKISLPNLSPSPSKNILNNNFFSGNALNQNPSPSPKIYSSDFDC